MLVRLSSHVIRHGYKTGIKYMLDIYAFPPAKDSTQVMHYLSLMLPIGAASFPWHTSLAKQSSPSPSASTGISPACFSFSLSPLPISFSLLVFLYVSLSHIQSLTTSRSCIIPEQITEPITSSHPTKQSPPAHAETNNPRITKANKLCVFGASLQPERNAPP